MNQFTSRALTSAISAAFLLGALSATAATTNENSDDGSALGTSDTPQIKQQTKRIDKKASNKSTKNYTQHHDQQMKMMDTNGNGMVSKDEYLAYHETAYGEMQPGADGVSYKNSMNNKPIGTTSGVSKNGSVDVTKEGPVNGTTTGTNTN